ncbi:MAG: type II toxin-antitoxin system VapC family toxin, partial [Deltaproteobacteria bacterium]|nr:type II toxin-antitoxin system VapC family toxin [Deltaproteobacteria bacterium]
NVCVDYLTGRHASVVHKIRTAPPDELCISAVVAAELRYGADRSGRRARNHASLDTFLSELRCVGFDAEAARSFGRGRRKLEDTGEPIGPYDMMIAAHALCLGVVLVTDNTREFRRVKDLKLENWRVAAV